MKTYDNYFDAARHLERNDPEDFTWKDVNTSSLAEVMDDAEQKGFDHTLVCYYETVRALNYDLEIRRRDMVFTRRDKT